TAGLALAARLSEDTTLSVLVLEAGEANLNEKAHLVPRQRSMQFNNPKFDWAFNTMTLLGFLADLIVLCRGKGLGGSSAMNFLVWNKPAREYLESFGHLGNEGWNWERFAEYSKKAERFNMQNTSWVSRSAENNITGAHVFTSPLDSCVFVSFNLWFRGSDWPQVHGTSMFASTLDPKTHLRAYATTVYYEPNASRINLTVLVSAHVIKVNTKANGDGTVTAIGASFLCGGSVHEVFCDKEVCLAAGAIMTPQILELSGIGDPNVQEKAGVQTKVELPGVGANVQEHLWSGIIYEVKQHKVDGREVNTLDPLLFPEEAVKHAALHPQGKGALNLATVCLVFLPLAAISRDAERLQRTVSETILSNIRDGKYPSGLQKQYEIQLRHLEQNVPSLEVMCSPGPIVPPSALDVNKKHVTIGFALNSPFSRGTIHITSKDPLAHPEIDPHVFEEHVDLQTLVELVKFCRTLAMTEPLKDILGGECDEIWPAANTETDEQIEDQLRNVVSTSYHTVGSCSMLPLEDGGVVDSRLKVYHTTNVRVVDLSIVPLHIGSH
ncbi:hypothetical protein POSPLADRAFT_1094491, partial [Postia placenta MAD-698-R-SB12]